MSASIYYVCEKWDWTQVGGVIRTLLGCNINTTQLTIPSHLDGSSSSRLPSTLAVGSVPSGSRHHLGLGRLLSACFVLRILDATLATRRENSL